MSRVGFTGTRQGMTPPQMGIVAVRLNGAAEFHHGGAIGADFQAHCLAVLWCHAVIVHLCSESRRASSLAYDRTTIVDPLPPLVRNRVIVDSTDRLLAAPAGFTEELRSGTWATIRYARRQGKPVTIVWPDGTATEEPGK